MKLSKKRIEWLAIVELTLERASTGPDAIASNIPYISMFPAKLCSIHLSSIIPNQWRNTKKANKKMHESLGQSISLSVH